MFEEFIAHPSAWLDEENEDSIVVSSRVRLARNVAGKRFPARSDDEDRLQLWQSLSESVAGLPSMSAPVTMQMSELNWTQRHILQERHLVSVDHGTRGQGSGVVFKQDESIAVMINEEDHIRMQAMCPGMDVESAWKMINQVDTELEADVKYAFSGQFGYLTACPSNVGTGMRASVMLHLPGLGLLNEIEPVCKGLTKIGLAVRGILGEGTEASGNMFQISNQTTLGEPEDGIISRLTEIVSEVAGHERNARTRLTESREKRVLDYVGRSYGVLMNAHLLSSREALDLLSGIRLGLDQEMVSGVSVSVINRLILLTQPGHMQKILGKELSPEERDEARAGIIREKLAALSIK